MNKESVNEPQAMINPLENQREAALKHYEEASAAIHHWSSFVENAIKAYNQQPTPSNESIEQMNFVENIAFLAYCEGQIDTNDGTFGKVKFESWFKSVKQSPGYAALVEMHQQAQGMKWVKASERLPNGKADIYHVKYNGQRDAIYFNPGDPESIGYWLDLDCEWLDEPRTP